MVPSLVSTVFEQLIARPPDEIVDDDCASIDKMPLEDLMDMWHGKEDEVQTSRQSTPGIVDLPTEELSDTLPELGTYETSIASSWAYDWLRATLRNRLILMTPAQDIGKHVRAVVLGALPKPASIRRTAPPPFVNAVFELVISLDPTVFMDRSTCPESFLTVTGSADEAQALTFGEYVQQTWPITGSFVTDLIRNILELEPGESCSVSTRTDGTRIAAVQYCAKTKIFMSATRDVIAETAEQLCWMCATLTPSPVEGGIVTCKPRICFAGQEHAEADDSMAPEDSAIKGSLGTSCRRCRITKTYCDGVYPRCHVCLLHGTDCEYSDNMAGKWLQVFDNKGPYQFQIYLDHDLIPKGKLVGTCWHDMFKHCVIVHGFPIRQRPKRSLGVEMSLNVIAELVGSKYVHDFAGRAFLKRFSMMATPVDQLDDVLVWHLCQTQAGKRISYLDHGLAETCAIAANDVHLEHVREFRHIIGWCSSIKYGYGVAHGKHAVGRSILPEVAANSALYGCTLSSRPVPVGPEHRFTPNHRPIVSSGTNYIEMFNSLERRSILFWDTQDQRGWLSNGLRALLHLLRQSLKIDEDGDAGDLFVLKQEDLEEPKQAYEGNAARKFLCNSRNLSTRIAIANIGHGSQEYEVLGDRVRQLYDTMEKCLDYQMKPMNWGYVPRSQLEGWDFDSIVRRENGIGPSTLTLPSMGKGWVDLVRAIGATTFFGEGFGELLSPGTDACPKLPHGRFYMAAAVADITKLMTMNRCHPRGIPRMISQRPPILWHSPSGSLTPCGCVGHKDSKGTDLTIQVLWPKSHAMLLPEPTEQLDLQKHANGAVIFGHNDTVQHYLPDFGPPVPGKPPDPIRELESYDDSGIGSSLESQADGSAGPVTFSIHGSAMAESSSRGNQSQAYGDSNITGGYNVLGNVAGNISVNQYYSMALNQGLGEGLRRSITQPSHLTTWGPVNARAALGPRTQSDSMVGTFATAQHFQECSIDASATDSSTEDIQVAEERQEGEEEIRVLGLEEYCGILRF